MAQQVNWMKIVVRLHNFPDIDWTVKITKLFGDKIGKFVDIPKTGDLAAIYYFRIRVMVDVSQPIQLGIYIQTEEGDKT